MERRFIARGNAVAFAGRITSVGDRAVDQPLHIGSNSSSLPVTGGLSMAETGPFALPHPESWSRPLVSFQAGTTRAWDEEEGDTGRVTHVMASIEGLAIWTDSRDRQGREEQFHIDRAAVYLKSSYRWGQAEPEIAIEGAVVDGVRCGKYAIAVNCDGRAVFNTVKTFDALSAAWSSGKVRELDRRIVRASARGPRPGDLPSMKETVPAVVCSLEWDGKRHPKVELEGNVLSWPGFGKVFFGELLIMRHLRRLTLLRFELGSPFAMRAAASEVESDGLGLP